MNKRQLSPAHGLFLLTFCVRLYVVLGLCYMRFFVPDSGDMKFYSDWGLRIAHGVWTDHQAFYGLPGYPFLLGLLFKTLNFDRFSVSVVAGLIQSLADAFTAVLIWKIGVEAFSEAGERGQRVGKVIGGAAAVGWALYQPAQAFSVVLMPTSLAVVAYWYCVWVVMRRRAFSTWKPWLGIGAVIGFNAMIVATILFAAPLALAGIVVRFLGETGKRNWLKPVAAAGVLFAGVYAGASPCWLHNTLVAHEPVTLSAHSGLNFYIGNNPVATGYPKMPHGMSADQQGMLKDSITLAEKAEGRPLKHYEVSQYWAGLARAYIAGHPVEWLKLMGRKFTNFWNSFQYDDLSLVTLFNGAGLLAPGPRYGWVAALAIPGLILALARRRRAWWIVAAVLLHMAALMPVFVTERYRLAAVPGMLLLGAYGLWEFWSFLSRARWAPALGYACGGVVVALWVAAPPADASLWSLDYYNTGIKAIDQQDYKMAEYDLETAYRYVPDNAGVNFSLGLLWQCEGDANRAKLFYTRALALNPRQANAWNNLGILAMSEKAWQPAVNCFQKAVALEPTDAKALYLEAQAYAQLGQWESAQTSIGAALRLAPEAKQFQSLAGIIAARGPLGDGGN